jgi:hypothetical protein
VRSGSTTTFARQHEQELAEIKALAHELDRRMQQGLEQLERIKEAQDRLVAPGQSPVRSAVGGNGAGPLVAFVHIPKTAGASRCSPRPTPSGE